MTIRDIYLSIKPEDLESKELSSRCLTFFNTYIKPTYKKNYDKGQEMDDLYTDLVWDYHEAGFIAGFKAAMSLFVDSVK